MKCQNCDGNGRFEVEDNGVVMQGVYWRCPNCGGKGIVEPLTNEEWFDALSTKEKAEWLFKLTYKCYWCGREYTPRSQSLYNEKECPFKKCMKDKKDFEKWLKQPHTFK